MIQKLLDKLKNTDSRVWKVLLGILLGVAVFFGAWYLKRLKKRIVDLEAQKALFEERKADAELRAKLEQDEKTAAKLREEAELLKTAAAEKETALLAEKKDFDKLKNNIDNATTWKELEKLARKEQ